MPKSVEQMFYFVKFGLGWTTEAGADSLLFFDAHAGQLGTVPTIS
jgi:hypothetical protein